MRGKTTSAIRNDSEQDANNFMPASAMNAACVAEYLGFRSSRIFKRMYATASSPWEGLVSPIPGE